MAIEQKCFHVFRFCGSLVTDRRQPCVPAGSGVSSSTVAADLVGSTPTTSGPATVGNSESSSLQEPSVAAESGESSATVALDNYCTQAVSNSITTVGHGIDDGITTPVSNVCSMSISVSTIPAAVENRESLSVTANTEIVSDVLSSMPTTPTSATVVSPAAIRPFPKCQDSSTTMMWR